MFENPILEQYEAIQKKRKLMIAAELAVELISFFLLIKVVQWILYADIPRPESSEIFFTTLFLLSIICICALVLRIEYLLINKLLVMAYHDEKPMSVADIKNFISAIDRGTYAAKSAFAPQEFMSEGTAVIGSDDDEQREVSFEFTPVSNKSIMISIYGDNGPSTRDFYAVRFMPDTETRKRWDSMAHTGKVELPFFRMTLFSEIMDYRLGCPLPCEWDYLLPCGENEDAVIEMFNVVCRHIMRDIAMKKVRNAVESRKSVCINDMDSVTVQDVTPYFIKGGVDVDDEIKREMVSLDTAVHELILNGSRNIEEAIRRGVNATEHRQRNR